MRGPLPDEQKRRRNAPTISTTPLPRAGRPGRPPKSPLDLGKVGKSWWNWAWSTPQSTQWDKGALYTVAHRAQLEDDLAAVDDSEKLVERIEDSMLRILESEHPADVPERLNYLGQLVGKLKSLGAGRVGVLKEMRELDKRLGLDPKAMAELRWSIEAEEKDGDDRSASTEGSDDNVRALRPKK